MAKARNAHVGSSVRGHIRQLRRTRRNCREAFDALGLARRLRNLRVELGLTQVELAERAKSHQSAIARLESGRVVPDLNLLARVARAMGLSLRIEFERGAARAH